MRFGIRRGAAAALALFCALAISAPASAGDSEDFLLHPTIPRLVPAMDLNTGGPYYAPPIPYGHYVGKECGSKALGLLCAPIGKVKGLLHHGNRACKNCGGAGCGLCAGGNGGGLFHHGGRACGACGGNGCNACGGAGFLGGAPGGPGGGPGAGGSFVVHGGGGGCGLGHGHAHNGLCGSPVTPTAQEGPAAPACGSCGGRGCGLCGGGKGKRFGHGCGLGGPGGCGGGLGGPGGPGCGGGVTDPCGSCGGRGCGLCGGRGFGGRGCKHCGGKGCGLCRGLGGKLLGSILGLTGAGNIKYFVGPGGPVPITPGYVPYVVTTRSPRDFFAFPPFSNVNP